jgi:hypothetical protein
VQETKQNQGSKTPRPSASSVEAPKRKKKSKLAKKLAADIQSITTPTRVVAMQRLQEKIESMRSTLLFVYFMIFVYSETIQVGARRVHRKGALEATCK